MNRLTLLQKELLLWVGLSLLVVFCSSFYIETMETEYDGIIRFHVLANSDSTEDQQLKLDVRDRVVSALEHDIQEAAREKKASLSTDFTRQYIKANLEAINKMAADTVKAEGFRYITKTKLGITYIPEKDYGDLNFPAGNYEALNITIGNGNGHNWFCVIYPPLCLVKAKGHRAVKLKWKVKSIIKKSKKRHKKTTRRF